MRYSIPGKAIRRQLHADLIGKDSYRGVTLTYSWLANQFGHFGLGFIPAFIVYKILVLKFSAPTSALWAAIGVSCTWLLFEMFNFLGPLKKHRIKKKVNDEKGDYTFKPAWFNVAFDTCTDVLFFALGAFIASLLVHWSIGVLITVISLVAALIYPCRYWYVTKLFLQTAQYPFQFRLSQWNFSLNQEQKKFVHQFVNNQDKGMHLLLFGAKGSGKTSLGVGIATEHSINHYPCVYTTGIKLYGYFFDDPDSGNTGDRPLWNWRCCTTLIIDDINPGEPIKGDIVSPESFMNLLDTYQGNPINRDTIKSSNVIWVLGTEINQQQTALRWKDMLEKELGIDEKRILSLHLK